MNFFDNHKKLFWTSLLFFVGLTILVAINPALEVQENSAPLPGAVPLTAQEVSGKYVYVANGCIACHTMQVRNVEMDEVWGERASIPADYADIHRMDFWRSTATLLGSERTGPDLTNIGNRQPSQAWNLLHLYQPRAAVPASVMPAYPWLFTTTDSVREGQIEVVIPDEYREGVKGKIIATQKALDLVAYLQSLKQTPLPDGTEPTPILYKNTEIKGDIKALVGGDGQTQSNGERLYAQHCQSCHQANGKGLPGAFPPLVGSEIVLGDNIELYVDIIMNGYDARAEFAVMTAVGTLSNLTPEEVTAIMNHERTSWGNDAEKVKIEDVKAIMESLQATAKK